MRLVAVLALLPAMVGCLRGDNRPEPGRVLVNVRRSEAARQGFTTDDGWHISFDRFVTSLAIAVLEPTTEADDCADYAFSSYDRLFDFAVADTSKLALRHGLGRCRVVFSMQEPSPDGILMAGVSRADRRRMLTGASDAVVDFPAPAALWIEGRAEHGATTKTFSWLIRNRSVIFKCFAPSSSALVNTVELAAGDELERGLVIRPQELFRRTPSLEARIEFGRFADADSDGDGQVTLDELDEVEVEFGPIVDDLRDELSDFSLEFLESQELESVTLATLLYAVMSGRVVAFEGAGECESVSPGEWALQP